MGLPSISVTSNQTSSVYIDNDQVHAAHANNAVENNVENNQADQAKQSTEQNVEYKFEEALSEEMGGNTTVASEAIDSNDIGIKNNFDKLPNEVLIETLRYLSPIDLVMQSSTLDRRFHQLSERTFLEKKALAQHTIQRCIDNNLASHQFPSKATLVAMALKKISVDIYIEWAKTENSFAASAASNATLNEPVDGPVEAAADELPDAINPNVLHHLDPLNAEAIVPNADAPNLPHNAGDNAADNTGASLAKKITSDLFKTLQKELPGPLISLLHQGKLSASQWQSWIQRIHDMGDEAPVGPFPFHKKIEQFLDTALALQNIFPTEHKIFKQVYDILSALHHHQAEHIKHLEDAVIQQEKISLALSLKEYWQKIEKISAQRTYPTSGLLHDKVQAIQERLAIFEMHAERLNKKTIDIFIAKGIDEWLSTHPYFHSLPQALLTFDAKEIVAPTWQTKIKALAQTILIKNGFSLKDAQMIVNDKHHEVQRLKDPISYIKHLSTLATLKLDHDVLKNFNFDQAENQFLLSVLDITSTQNPASENPLRTALIEQKISWSTLHQLCWQLINVQLQLGSIERDYAGHSTSKNFPSPPVDLQRRLQTPLFTLTCKNILQHHAKIFRNIVPFMNLEHLSKALINDQDFTIAKFLAHYGTSPRAINVLIELEKKLGAELYEWLSFTEAPKHLSLPFALQNAFESGLNPTLLSNQHEDDSAYKNRFVITQLCRLFGFRMWEYGNDMRQAITEKLISPKDIEEHFSLQEISFERKNIKRFCKYILPRILKREITFKEFAEPLQKLNKLFENIPESFLQKIYQVNMTQFYFQGISFDTLSKLFTALEPLPIAHIPAWFGHDFFPFYLEEGTITLQKIVEWFTGSPPVSLECLNYFYDALVYVHAGTLQLETLETWMRDKDFHPDTQNYFLLHQRNFDPVFAQRLQNKEVIEPLSQAQENIFVEYISFTT